MKKDSESAPRYFWKTVWHLRRGKWENIQTVYSKGGALLSSTEYVIGQPKENFEGLLKPTNPPSATEAELWMMGDQHQVPWRRSLRQ